MTDMDSVQWSSAVTFPKDEDNYALAVRPQLSALW